MGSLSFGVLLVSQVSTTNHHLFVSLQALSPYFFHSLFILLWQRWNEGVLLPGCAVQFLSILEYLEWARLLCRVGGQGSGRGGCIPSTHKCLRHLLTQGRCSLYKAFLQNTFYFLSLITCRFSSDWTLGKYNYRDLWRILWALGSKAGPVLLTFLTRTWEKIGKHACQNSEWQKTWREWLMNWSM